MTHMAAFTIITITRNNLDGLKRTAHSIEQQGCTDYEWVIIDGASDDSTVDFLQTQKMATWVSEPDHGIYDAMNKGIERAQGRFTIFMNAGDIFADKSVLLSIKSNIENSAQDVDFIYGDAIEDAHFKPARSHKYAALGMFTHHQSMLYKTENLKQFRYDSNHSIAADYDLTLRFLRAHQKAHYIPITICDFEPGGVSQQQAGEGRKQQFHIRRTQKICDPITNIIIYVLQVVRYKIRQYAPAIYWNCKRSRKTN